MSGCGLASVGLAEMTPVWISVCSRDWQSSNVECSHKPSRAVPYWLPGYYRLDGHYPKQEKTTLTQQLYLDRRETKICRPHAWS